MTSETAAATTTITPDVSVSDTDTKEAAPNAVVVAAAVEVKEDPAATAEEAPASVEMEYRMLGGTGLKVSTLSFGFFGTFGVKAGLDTAVTIMRHCRAAGINFFDNAEAYGTNYGDAEVVMGKALKRLESEDADLWRRTDLVISTKIFWGGKGANEKGLSRKHIREAMDNSLQRLQLEYVDIVFCHRPDRLTPTEEVVRGMSQLVSSGKAFYWGTSTWSSDHIMEAIWIAKSLNLVPPCVEQPQYNMFTRDKMEKEYLRIFAPPYNIGTTIWGPLNAGILTGKYNDAIPEDSRMAHYKSFQNRITAEKISKVRLLQEYAKDELNSTSTVLAIAWAVKCRNVSTVLLGASKEYQILENLKALELAVRLTKKNMDDIDAILGNKPKDEYNFGRSLKNIVNPF